MQTNIRSHRRPTPKQCVCLGTAFLLSLGSLGLSGCGSVAPSKTATGAGTGAVVGALGGAAIGANSSMGTGVGAVGGAAAGALVGGVIGLIGDAKERKEQDSLAQQRAYQQELAKKRADEARIKLAMEEEILAQQGFRITDLELEESKRKREAAAARLKNAEDTKAAAIARTKQINEDLEKTLADEARAAAVEEEIARLKSDTPLLQAPAVAAESSAGPALANPPLTP